MTAPVVSGEMVLRPTLDAFLDAYPTVSAKLLLFDRTVNLIEESIDVALRIGPLADSAMIAMRVGEISRVVVPAPRYLKQHPRITEPGDLAKHQIVAMAHLPNSWTFAPKTGSLVPRTVQFIPRLVVNSTYAAVASSVAGRGVARMYSYQVAERSGAASSTLYAETKSTPKSAPRLWSMVMISSFGMAIVQSPSSGTKIERYTENSQKLINAGWALLTFVCRSAQFL